MKIDYRKEFDRLTVNETAEELTDMLKNLDTDGVPFASGGRAGYNTGLSVLGFTPEHIAAVEDMKMNPGKYGIESQFDYAAASTKDAVVDTLNV